ncbi:metallophosphoesterase family protein [Streptomyces sp. NPDC002867]
MRLVHTSDWHLGRQTSRHARDSDFDAVLEEITGITREARPDLIVHSGDLFDTYRPATRDIMRAMRALDALQAIAPTVVVAGNHDSPALFDLLNYLCGSGLHGGTRRLNFIGSPDDGTYGRVLDFGVGDGTQRIRLGALPFIHANRFLGLSSEPGTTAEDYSTGLRGIQADLMTRLRDGFNAERDVLVFAAHLFVAGAVPSYTERALDITETYATAAADLPAVSYGALGHIHKPQAVAGVPFAARYAGSPLQLDFGEAGESKSIVVVDADPGRPTRISLRPLTAGRRLAEFTGTLQDLAQRAHQYTDTFLKVTITSDEPTVHLAQAVADAVPGALVVETVEDCAKTQLTVLDRAAADAGEPEITESFRTYLTACGTPGHVADDVLGALVDLLSAPDGDPPPPCTAENLLEEALQNSWTSDTSQPRETV